MLSEIRNLGQQVHKGGRTTEVGAMFHAARAGQGGPGRAKGL